MINVEEHLGIAQKVAHQYLKHYKGRYTYDELESAAFLGLVKASKKFNNEKGVQFSTYAYLVAEGEIRNMARGDKWYFVKRGVYQEMYSLNYVIEPEHNTEMQDILQDETDIEENAINRVTINKLLDLLSDRDRKIVYLYFYEQLAQPKISEIMNIAQSSVSRIIRDSIKKMREELVA